MYSKEEEKASSVIYIIFITLTALGVVAVLVVLGMLIYKEARTDKTDTFSLASHQKVIEESVALAEKVIETDRRIQEERKAAEEAARKEAEAERLAAEEAKKDFGMNFVEVEETVTAKDVTNLRDMPSQGEGSTIMATLENGQTATRIGTSETGWSKLEYNGEIYYAVSSLLTTDLTVKPQEPVVDDGIKTVFTDCSDRVSPKIEVNLRTLPSVTNPDSVVVVTLPYGAVVTRTGINTDVGWSRVEYEGQVLYCISSYVYVVE